MSGSFDMAGNPIATAEAPVVPIGFGPDIDGADLVASVVTDEITFDEDGGWITTVEVQQREQSKSKKKGGGSAAAAAGDYSLWEAPS